MKVYEARPVHAFQSIQLDDRGLKDTDPRKIELDEIWFHAQAIDNWIPPKVYSYYASYPEPDIWDVDGRGAFAVPPKVLDLLDPIPEMAGQLLPLPFKGQELTICHIRHCIDCVDEEKSEWRISMAGNRVRILKPAFFPDCFQEPSLFKIPQLPDSIYCWEQAEDPEMEFRACVLEHKLKGLIFHLVWEG